MNLDTLKEISDSLSNSDSELMKEIEGNVSNDEALTDIVSSAIELANKIEDFLAKYDSVKDEFSEESLDAIAAIADQFDEEGLHKEASVLDQILLTIGADKKKISAIKKAEQDEIDKLRKKYYPEKGGELYTKAKEKQKKENNVEEAEKAIEKKVKKFRPLEASLSTRYSPDMPGVSLIRISDSIYQCPITKKLYDFKAGFTTAKGNKVPGGDVSNQTQFFGNNSEQHMMFSTREQVLNNK